MNIKTQIAVGMANIESIERQLSLLKATLKDLEELNQKIVDVKKEKDRTSEFPTN